jgi:hypothetical protein
MNWYKTSQSTEEVKDKSLSSYLSIGHTYKDNCRSYIWIFINGKIETKEPYVDVDRDGLPSTHPEVWGEHYYEKYYNGRTEVCEGKNPIISLRVPDNPVLRFREVPHTIISALESKWPNANIFIYR